MPDEADLVWGDLATACRVRFPGALSSREKPPRQRQSSALPGMCAGGKFATARSVAESGSAAYSNITAGLHEYFLHTRTLRRKIGTGRLRNRQKHHRPHITNAAHVLAKAEPCA